MILDLSAIFLLFLLSKFLVQNYLDFRNFRHLSKHEKKVPSEFIDTISPDDHLKASHYTKAKIRLTALTRSIEFLMILYWLFASGIESISSLAQKLYPDGTIQDILTVYFYSLTSFLVRVPARLYETFVIEERFHFNKMSLSLFMSDLAKESLVSLALGLPLLYGLFWFIAHVNPWWPWAFFLFFSFQLIMMWVYPRVIAPLFNQFTPLKNKSLRERIERLANQTGFSLKDIFVMDASKRSLHGNAYFTGLGKEKRIVFFDSLLNTLTPDEIEAVLAHEIGHFKMKHIRKGLVRAFFLSLFAFSLANYLFNQDWFFLGHGVNIAFGQNGAKLLVFSLVLPIYFFCLTPVASQWSRKHEYDADQFAHQHSSSLALISALKKLFKENASSTTVDKLYSSFYYSHPPAKERIAHLKLLASGMSK